MEAVSTHVRILWDHSTVAVTLDIYYNPSSSVWVGSELGDIWCLLFPLRGGLPTYKVKIALKSCNFKHVHASIILDYVIPTSFEFGIWSRVKWQYCYFIE